MLFAVGLGIFLLRLGLLLAILRVGLLLLFVRGRRIALLSFSSLLLTLVVLVERLVLVAQALLLSSNHVLPQITLRLAILVNRRRLGSVLSLSGGPLGIKQAATTALIRDLERSGSAQHTEGETLSVDTGLNKLLLTTEVWVATDEGEGAQHRGNPGRTNDLVLFATGEGSDAVGEGLTGALLGAEALLAGLVPLCDGVALVLEFARRVIGGDDTGESTGGCHQEGFHGHCQVSDRVVTARSKEDTCNSNDETGYTSDGATLKDLTILLVSVG